MPIPNVNDRSQFLIFRVADQPAAARLSEISEITLMAELSKPIGHSSLLAGLLNIGGQALTVLHLDRCLGLEASSSEARLYSHILLVRTRNHAESSEVGFLVQAAEKILDVKVSDITNDRIPFENGFLRVVDLQTLAEQYAVPSVFSSHEALPFEGKAAS